MRNKDEAGFYIAIIIGGILGLLIAFVLYKCN